VPAGFCVGVEFRTWIFFVPVVSLWLATQSRRHDEHNEFYTPLLVALRGRRGTSFPATRRLRKIGKNTGKASGTRRIPLDEEASRSLQRFDSRL
jgi:hypothetical protein